MYYLSSATHKIQIVTGSAGSILVHASFADRATTPFSATPANVSITTATTTDIVTGNVSGVNLKSMAIANDAGTSNDITVLHTDGTTAVPIYTATLAPDAVLHYDELADGWIITPDSAGSVASVVLDAVPSEPATPAAGKLIVYSKDVAGRVVPKVKGPSGVDYPLQASFWQNNIVQWTTTTATAGVWQGTAGAGAGTYTTALPTTTNIYTAQTRGRWANVVTTLNQVLGQRNTQLMFSRGNSGGQGGFFFFARCGFDVWTNGGRFFAGMHTATTVVSADPSALNNTVGFCVDAADNGAISFLTRGTAATKASTGMTIVSNRGYDLYAFCPPSSNRVSWRIVDRVGDTEASGTATLNLPVSTTMLTAGVLASNAALTPVTSIQLGLNRIYVETDF